MREYGFPRWRVIFFLAGGLLVTAAGLKLFGVNVTPVSRFGWLAQPRIQLLVAEWELCLGLWLLSGRGRALAWLVALTTFVVFAGFSFYLGWIGVANCGCFRVIKASPWAAFSVDLLLICLLAVGWPHRAGGETLSISPAAPSFSPGVSVLFAGVGLFTLILIGGSIRYGSLNAMLGRLNNEELTVDEQYLDFGSAQSGAIVERAVAVRNWSDRPVRIVGGSNDCSCGIARELPVTVPPQSKLIIPIRMLVPRTAPGMFTRTVELWTDCPSSRIVRFEVGCYIHG